jgi:allantoate deiminase
MTAGSIAKLDALYRIGVGEGANRPGLSEFEDEAHRLMGEWMHDAGLVVSVDAAGNLYGRLLGSQPQLPEIWCGSHLDSVPGGGRYDGALGVVAALEATAMMDQQRRTVTVVAFRDEEGWRFGDGFLGSRAVTGAISDDTLERFDRDGVTVRAALAQAGRVLTPAKGWLVPAPAAYIEAHIEQGPVLAALGEALGVVESIVGMLELQVVFEGRAGHAGTTPMDVRRDASLCAASFHVEAARIARGIPRAVVTVGSDIRLEPGAANVIARRSTLTLDARAPNAAALDELEAELREAASASAEAHRCGFSIAVLSRIEPEVCDEGVRAALQRAVPGVPELPSGAGHDAQILAAAGVAVGMLFVRSLNDGISHSPNEATSDEDVAAAIHALRGGLTELAGADDPA